MKIGKGLGAIALMAAALTAGVLTGAQAQDKMDHMDMSRYGGPTYSGKPALSVTSSLVKAGGGMDFSVAKALTSMLGEKTVEAELGKLTRQYGEEKVKSFVDVHNFAVQDALRIATEAGVKLPSAPLSGKKLAMALLTAGMAKDGTFYTEFLLDKALTHKIHEAVMDDIDKKFGAEADMNYHMVSNQAWYDIGQALGVKKVKLAKSH